MRLTMMRIFLRLDNLWPILFFIVLGTQLSFADQKLDSAFFEIKIKNNHSELKIDLPDNWQIKLLNSSPAHKILLKIFQSNKSKQNKLQIKHTLPRLSCVQAFRTLPLKPGNYLVVLELSDKISYEWNLEKPYHLIIHDEFLFDESEREYRKGLVFHRQGRLNDALTAYRKAIFKNRKHGNAYYKAAQIRYAWKQFHLAEINFKHALRLGCDSLKIYLDLSKFYQDYGKKELAKKYLQVYYEKIRKQQTDEKVYITKNVTKQENSVEKNAVANDSLAIEPTKEKMIPQEANSKRKIPLRIVIYLTASLILFLFITLSVVRRVWQYFHEHKREIETSSNIIIDPQKLEEQKLKILQVAKQMENKLIKYENGNKPVEQTNNSQTSKIKTTSNDENLVSLVMENELFDAVLPEDNYVTHDEKLDMAKGLNLGIGEIELALNLTAQQRKEKKEQDIGKKIEKLFNSNLDISEIARRMSLGRGEVELILALKGYKIETSSLHPSTSNF